MADRNHVDTLLEMGFAKVDAENALLIFENDVELALEWLFKNSSPTPEIPPESSRKPNVVPIVNPHVPVPSPSVLVDQSRPSVETKGSIQHLNQSLIQIEAKIIKLQMKKAQLNQHKYPVGVVPQQPPFQPGNQLPLFRPHDQPRANQYAPTLVSQRQQSQQPQPSLQQQQPPPQQQQQQQGSINDKELVLIDDNFQKQVRSHPLDCESIIFGYLSMVLKLPNHPLAKVTGFPEWSHSWFIPYSRIENPSPVVISRVAELILGMMSKTVDASFDHYQFLKRKQELFQWTVDAVIQIVWSYTFGDCFGLICKANRIKDQELSKKIQMLSLLKLSQLDIRVEFWLDHESNPYQPAIACLKQLPSFKTVNSKLDCLSNTASKICSCVAQNWDPKEVMGGDEFLPLMAYVVIKANIPNAYSESVFLETFIDEQKGIQEEGYILATYLSALSLIEQLIVEGYGRVEGITS